MPTPSKGYWIGKQRIPSVTTVISRYKFSDPLLWWAWDCGMKGIDYKDARQAAATAGTCAHAMVEAKIRGKKFDPEPYSPEILETAENSYSAFTRWAEQSRLEPGDTELSLVSMRHRFGGTLDCVSLGGELRLIDFKTSASVYPEYLLQLAAYGLLYEENYGRKIEGYDILRFDKSEHADFAHHSFRSLTKEKAHFLLLRKAYEFDQQLKKRVR